MSARQREKANGAAAAERRSASRRAADKAATKRRSSSDQRLLEQLLAVLEAARAGDFSVRMDHGAGLHGELASAFNGLLEHNERTALEISRVSDVVGREGRTDERASIGPGEGSWATAIESVNSLIESLARPSTEVSRVLRAVAEGDLDQTMALEIEGQPVRGEFLRIGMTVNQMVDQLSSFAAEVTRVAREVGTEGRLGGQAEVAGVSGTWKDLTESVNFMARNLTAQVRDIAQVTTAVATGDLSQKISVDARGETLELKETINTMVDQLRSFADEVTRVAHEVGTEGKLGGQARVEDVSGTWRRLTDNVNQLAGNLTTQVRAIAEVSTAVTEGDLTRSITVDAQGEVAELKGNVNEMIVALRDTTRRNAEQDWLKTNLARISGLMQGQRELQAVSRLIMSELTPTVSAHHGAFFLAESDDGAAPVLRLIASYGYTERKSAVNRFELGEGLVGQAALEKQPILITGAPPGYIRISSGLGEAAPVNVIVLPIMFEDQVLAVIELASLQPFSDIDRDFLDQLTESIGVVLNSITANMRTEELLQQSQSLTQELQSQSEELQTQQEELRQSNEELEEKAKLLADHNRAIEVKNEEIELARTRLEDKAERLALSSRYSEFLANVSHELRTPLNSLLILAKLLADNGEGNLSAKQVEFAQTIYDAGSELLALINDILDLSKVEAGKMDMSPSEIELASVPARVEASFRPLAEEKGLVLDVGMGDGLPRTVVTDEQRLHQVLKNLLSNAIKFTDTGGVGLRVEPAAPDERYLNDELASAALVVAFRVIDSGIGIADDKLKLIFEAFQQADGTTSRRYGGTGLGLSISREIARVLGGELQVRSSPGEGSAFSLFLPADAPADPPAGDPGTAGPALVPAPPEPARHPAPDLTSGREPGGADPSLLAPGEIPDDRDDLAAGDRVLLVIEDGPDAARTALTVGRARGFKCLLAPTGDSGLALAHEFKPDAIVLDAELPATDGLAVLDHLKQRRDTRHIPVQVLSTPDHRRRALRAGALSCLDKPVTREALAEALGGVTSFLDRDVRRLLLVDDNASTRASVGELIGSGDDVAVTAAGSNEEAVRALEQERFGCMVLDLEPSDTRGLALLETLKADERFADLPVIVYTAEELTRDEETELRRHTESGVIKHVSSRERLFDETALFLHRVDSHLPAEKRRELERLHSADEVFRDKKVLIVDDDVRNVFALTNALERRGIDVLFAENGRDGLETLHDNPDVDLVLMDVMMPEMDGYETTRALRGMPEFEHLPVIGLTAKAMKGDREKSIAAGASDYITKPVETDQLLEMMRVWLYR